MQVSKNCMGTVTFVHKFEKMRKEQEFDVYPMDKKSSEKVITIQSNTRIGQINLDNGNVCLSESHSNGAYFIHLGMDALSKSTLSTEDLNTLKNAIIGTAGELVGNNGLVYCDNSKAELIK
jgi:hypothetical protein